MNTRKARTPTTNTRRQRTEQELLRSLGFPATVSGAANARTEAGSEPLRPGKSAEANRGIATRIGARVAALITARLAAVMRRLKARAFRAFGSKQLLSDERGAVTAEYALVIMAAVAFAGLLIVIMRSEEVRAMLLSLVQSALGAAG